MATLSEILGKRWPGREWALEGDDYGTLIWGHLGEDGDVVNTNPEAKPNLAAIQAFANDVDLEIATDRRDEKREAALSAVSIGQWFKIVDALYDWVAVVHPALPANTRTQVPAPVVQRVQAFRNKLNEIIAQNP